MFSSWIKNDKKNKQFFDNVEKKINFSEVEGESEINNRYLITNNL